MSIMSIVDIVHGANVWARMRDYLWIQLLVTFQTSPCFQATIVASLGLVVYCGVQGARYCRRDRTWDWPCYRQIRQPCRTYPHHAEKGLCHQPRGIALFPNFLVLLSFLPSFGAPCPVFGRLVSQLTSSGVCLFPSSCYYRPR